MPKFYQRIKGSKDQRIKGSKGWEVEGIKIYIAATISAFPLIL
jgi:hypothetical protein